jgi:hypothetical protein
VCAVKDLRNGKIWTPNWVRDMDFTQLYFPFNSFFLYFFLLRQVHFFIIRKQAQKLLFYTFSTDKRWRREKKTLNHTIEIIRLTNILELDQQFIYFNAKEIFYTFEVEYEWKWISVEKNTNSTEIFSLWKLNNFPRLKHLSTLYVVESGLK